MIRAVAELAFNAFATLLIVLGPPGMAPIFVGLTQGRSGARRREAAIGETALGTAICYLRARRSGASGCSRHRFRGVLDCWRSSLLFLLSLDIVFARPSGMRRVVQEGEEVPEDNDISVFSLAIPLIEGPGTLTTILLYTDNSDLTEVAAVMEVLLAVLLIVHVSLLLAPRVVNVFRRTFANVLSRILGVLLAAF